MPSPCHLLLTRGHPAKPLAVVDKAPFLSLFVCVLYQLIVSFPHYLPACIPLLALAPIVRNYIVLIVLGGASAYPIATPPSVAQLHETLLLGKSVPPLRADPVPRHVLEEGHGRGDKDRDETLGAIYSDGNESSDDDKDSDSDGGGGEAGDEERGTRSAPPTARGVSGGGAGISGSGGAGKKHRKTARASRVERMLGYGHVTEALASSSSVGLLEAELARLHEEVEEQVEADLEGACGSSKSGNLGSGHGKSIFNPLASLLGPVQLFLGRLLVRVRTLKRLLTWQDRFLTLVVCFVLLTASAALALIGRLLSLLPWGLIVEWSIRLLGLALLGPHMYWVGKHYEGRQAEANAREAEFRAASAEQRAAILSSHRARILAELTEVCAGARPDRQLDVSRDRCLCADSAAALSLLLR